MRAHGSYLIYVIRHKWYVAIAGHLLGVPWWQLLKHDLGKFSPAEWGAYVRWFKAGDKSPAAKLAFDAAWRHHWTHNPHHWQYWCGGDGSFISPMPEMYAREMVADWCGAGRAITGTWEIAEWYAKSQAHIILHPNTRLRVETLIAEAVAALPT